ncbi:HNH endonuclease family protein [Candidatus Saccharibacteria bacterium]|nr:HNH endonuclease family protein [Candidatus Saccharibacteria bacterium]
MNPNRKPRKNKSPKHKLRQLLALLVFMGAAAALILTDPNSYEPAPTDDQQHTTITPATHGDSSDLPLATEILSRLEIKGRAPRTGYSRSEFGSGWGNINGCDARNVILYRDLTDVVLDGCLVLSGTLHCPYTDQIINFIRGPETSNEVHIDHVVALSDAWQKGAQNLTREQRIAFSNDPLNLLAVDGPANMQKGDSDAASWLPPHRPFRCQFVARQISVKFKHNLWVTQAEHDAKYRVLQSCPDQRVLEYAPSFN